MPSSKPTGLIQAINPMAIEEDTWTELVQRQRRLDYEKGFQDGVIADRRVCCAAIQESREGDMMTRHRLLRKLRFGLGLPEPGKER